MSNPSPVVIQFALRGVEQAKQAMRSISDAMVAAERRGLTATSSATTSKEAEYRKLARQTEQWQRQQVAGADRAAKAEAAAAARSAMARARATDTAERQRERSFADLARKADKWANEELRSIERAESEKTKATERAESRRNAIRERSATMAGRFAAKQAEDEARAREQAERRAEQRRTQFSNAIQGGVAGAGRTLTRGATALASTTLQLGGGFAVQDVLHDRLSLERNAALLSNASVTPDHPTRIDPAAIVDRAKAASITTGTDANELLAGLNAYVAKSADFEGGSKNLDFFAKVAKGTGSSVEAVMRTAGVLRVQNKDLDDKSMRELLLSTVMQARQGSVEFEDMARAGGKITRTAAMFTGNQGDNQRKLLGLSQIGMRTAGNDVAEAATNLANLQSDATMHAADVERLLGRKFKDDKGRIVGGMDVFLGNLIEAAMARPGGLDQLSNVGGNGKRMFGQRSMKMFQALAPVYNEAEEEALKSGKSKEEAQAAGAAAVRKDISTTIASKYDEKDLDKDFATVMSSASEQFAAAVRQLKTDIADALVPEIKRLVPVLQQVTPPLVSLMHSVISLVNWMSGHPFQAAVLGLGASITKAVMGEIIAAKIGDTIKMLLSGAGAGGGSVPGVGGAGASGGAGAGGALAGGLVVAGIAGSAMNLAGLADETYRGVVEGRKQAKDIAADLASSDPARVAAAQRAVQQAREKGTTGAAASAWTDRALRTGTAIVAPSSFVGTMGGDWLTHTLGGKTQGDRANEALTAHAVASSPEVAKALAATATSPAVRALVNEAAARPAPPATAAAPNPSPGAGGGHFAGGGSTDGRLDKETVKGLTKALERNTAATEKNSHAADPGPRSPSVPQGGSPGPRPSTPWMPNPYHRP